MAFRDILLSGLWDNLREKQREEDRPRRRKHRSQRHSNQPDYRSTNLQESFGDESDVYSGRRKDYGDRSRRAGDDAPGHRSTVHARGGVTKNEYGARASDRRRRRRHVSMRRTPSSVSSSTSADRETPPTSPGSLRNTRSVEYQSHGDDKSRAEVQVRGLTQDTTDRSADEDYSQLRPGRRKLRTGHSVQGAHGTDFMVGVPSDIGSLSSESTKESEPEPEKEAPSKGVHLKIVTRPDPEDMVMRGALAPGSAPYRRIGPPTSPPLIRRTSSKQESIFSQIMRPSPHHDNLKRRSTVSNRPKRRQTEVTSARSQSSTVTRNTPTATPSTAHSRGTAPPAPPSTAHRRSAAPSAPPSTAHRRTTAHPAPPSTTSRRTSAPHVSQASTPKPRAQPAEPEATVMCLTCCDDVPVSQAATLKCDHHWCRNCLKHLFEMSVTDPAHMPPKCCTADFIPLNHVAPLFDNQFKMLWNKKFQEFSTKDRMYCPKKGCGEWIKPEHQKLDRSLGRRCGTCSHCGTKVCKTCNQKWHGKKDCKNDPETKQLLDTAKKEGWQKCYNCKAMVQLAEGCNHMTCRCTAEFCMICGLRWKTCDCPWFNTPPEDDPLAGLFFQPEARFRPRVRMRADGNGGPLRPFLDPGAMRAQGYQAQMEARRLQEAEDEEFARRLQGNDFRNVPNPFHPGAAGAIPMLDLAGRFARIIIEHANEAQQEAQETNIRLSRNATVQAAWRRPAPRRRATVDARPRARAPAPEPPAAAGSITGGTDNGNNSRDGHGRPHAGRHRASGGSRAGGPSTAAMAGLGHRDGRQRDRVGGWLDHISGGPQHYE